MLKIPHCLDNRLRDCAKVVNPTHQQNFTPNKHYYFCVSGTHFAHNFVGEVIANFFVDKECHVVGLTDPYVHILGFLDRSRYFSIT
jgi:hypothetical protein